MHVSDAIMRYAVDITATSRGAGSAPSRDCHPCAFGCLAARHHRLDPYRPGEGVAVRARLCGAEDLKAFAHEVLRHRIMLTFEALADGVVSDQIVDKIVETVPVP